MSILINMKLEVKNGEIRQLIIGDIMFPLKKNIKLSEAERLEEAVSYLEEFIDFANIGSETIEKKSEEGFEWTEDELRSFLDQTDSERQDIFLRSLAKNPTRLS